MKESGAQGPVRSWIVREFGPVAARLRRPPHTPIVLAVVVFVTLLVAKGPSGPLVEIGYVVVGVAISLLLLPPLQDDLWYSDSETLASTVPRARLRDAVQEALGAVAGQDVGPVAWAHAIEPMLDAYEVGSFREDFRYEVFLRRDEDTGDVVCTTSNACRRHVRPENGRIWVTLATSNEALLEEYGSPACVARELTSAIQSPAGTRPWTVDVAIGGIALKQTEPAYHSDEGARVTRVRVPFECAIDTLLTQRGTSAVALPEVAIRSTFRLPFGERNFPVILRGYYCAGVTEIAVRWDPIDKFDVRLREEAVGLSNGESESAFRVVSSGVGELVLEYPGPLLWPGTRLDFVW